MLVPGVTTLVRLVASRREAATQRLWDTLDGAITELRAGGHEVRDQDATRLSPFGRHHINLLGRYSFLLPADLGGGLRPLREHSRCRRGGRRVDLIQCGPRGFGAHAMRPLSGG